VTGFEQPLGPELNDRGNVITKAFTATDRFYITHRAFNPRDWLPLVQRWCKWGIPVTQPVTFVSNFRLDYDHAAVMELELQCVQLNWNRVKSRSAVVF
jgi:hypothetical protein